MLATASVAMHPCHVASGDLWFPQTRGRLDRLFGVGAVLCRGMTSILYAAATLGATRVAVVMNIEPLASIVLTFLILGERLRPAAAPGALLVIAAIFLVPAAARAGCRCGGRESLGFRRFAVSEADDGNYPAGAAEA